MCCITDAAVTNKNRAQKHREKQTHEHQHSLSLSLSFSLPHTHTRTHPHTPTQMKMRNLPVMCLDFELGGGGDDTCNRDLEIGLRFEDSSTYIAKAPVDIVTAQMCASSADIALVSFLYICTFMHMCMGIYYVYESICTFVNMYMYICM